MHKILLHTSQWCAKGPSATAEGPDYQIWNSSRSSSMSTISWLTESTCSVGISLDAGGETGMLNRSSTSCLIFISSNSIRTDRKLTFNSQCSLSNSGWLATYSFRAAISTLLFFSPGFPIAHQHEFPLRIPFRTEASICISHPSS